MYLQEGLEITSKGENVLKVPRSTFGSMTFFEKSIGKILFPLLK